MGNHVLQKLLTVHTRSGTSEANCRVIVLLLLLIPSSSHRDVMFWFLMLATAQQNELPPLVLIVQAHSICHICNSCNKENAGTPPGPCGVAVTYGALSSEESIHN